MAGQPEISCKLIHVFDLSILAELDRPDLGEQTSALKK